MATNKQIAEALARATILDIGRAVVYRNQDEKDLRCILRLGSLRLKIGDKENGIDKVENNSIDDSGSLAGVHVDSLQRRGD